MNPKAASLTLLALSLVLPLGLGGCVDRDAQAIAKGTGEFISSTERAVRVEKPRVETLEETVDVSGDVTTGLDVQASFRAPGRLAALYVRDGDRVTPGQLIAVLDTTTLVPQVQQASAQLQSAQATYQQALKNAQLNPARSNAGVQQAEAQLRSARASLTKSLRGARTEERAQAQAQVASARSTVTATRKDLDRYRNLVREGAIAQQRVDQAQNAYETAVAQLNIATQALSTLTTGTRTEDIAVAREAVRQAEGAVQTAKATRSLDATFTDAANAARGQVQAAQAQLRLVQQNLTDAQLRAPIAGRVLGEPLQLGTVVTAGTQVVRIIGEGGAYFEGQVPSARLSQVQAGQDVRTRVDALPGKTFTGRIASIAPQGEAAGRIFNARILFPGGAPGVRPGMFARGTVIVRRIEGALTLPTSAINTGEDGRYVVVNENGKAKRVKVEIGLVRNDRTQVSGLNANALVVIQGAAGLVEGDKLKVEDPNAAPAAGTGNSGGNAAGNSPTNSPPNSPANASGDSSGNAPANGSSTSSSEGGTRS